MSIHSSEVERGCVRVAARRQFVSILTASTGGGHDSVARNLFDVLSGDHRAVVDTELLGLGRVPELAPFGAKCEWLYGRVIVHYPWLWGLVYGLTNNDPFWRATRWLARTPGSSDSSWVERSGVILSVHPICTQAIARSLARREWRGKLVALITDLYEAHAAWVAAEVDVYIAPTQEVALSLSKRGVDRRQIRVLGLPLDRRFDGCTFDKRLTRLEMGLDADGFTVLLTGGGEGAGSIFEAARAIAGASLSLQLIVACGRNERLRRQLVNLSLGRRVVVLGFEENMAPILEAADVVVGKAGALTVAESIVLSKPMIVLRPLGGQEHGNLRFATKHGLCASVPDANALVLTLRRWLLDGAEMEMLRLRAAIARRPLLNAADQVAQAVIELAT